MYYPSSSVLYERYLRECEKYGIEPLEYDDWQDTEIDRSRED